MKLLKRRTRIEIPEREDIDESGAVQITYTGFMTRIILVISVIMSFFQLYYSTIGVMDAVKFRSWHLGFLLIFAFILYPARKNRDTVRVRPTVFDMICIGISIVSIGYFLLTYDDFIRERYGVMNFTDVIFGGLGILMLFEAARRVVGNVLTIIAAIFLLYNFYGVYIPGILGHNGFTLERVINVMFWGGQGIFGVALGTSATFIFVFILFGAFLKNSGFSEFINDLALTIAGRSAGGPAKVSVLASSLMGMMSGSAVGNVVTTGAVTIPMMKKYGFKPRFAGAVEAVASTGGTIAPPVMGAAAFIMAQYLGISYAFVVVAAIVPAVLYYFTLFMAVHFEAKNMGLSGISKENLPQAKKVLKEKGHLSIPLFVLIGGLATGITPLYAALWAIFATVIASWLRKSTRMGLKKILQSFEEGVKASISVGIACAIVGIVIGTITLTSLGLVVGNNVIALAGDNVLIAAILTMIICIILGMGIPVTAAYIIVAAICVPILINMGIVPIAAHMFAFMYAALSAITPPVALASYAAAGLAGTDSNKVGFEAVRLGSVGFITPFFFLFNPVLLLQGDDLLETIVAIITALIGSLGLAAGLKARLFVRLNILERILMVASGLLLIYPGYIAAVVGIALFGVVTIRQFIIRKRNNQLQAEISK